MNTYIVYDGRKYWASSNKKYFYADKRIAGKRIKIALHRQIWMDHNKSEIPIGYDIHHIDENTLNNSPENLECKENSAHLRDHMRKRLLDPTALSMAKQNMKKACEAAIAWHKTEEGSRWHSEHAKEGWLNRTRMKKSCINCGLEYETFRTDSKFCGKNCSNKHKDKNKVYFEKRECYNCGAEYETRKVSTAKICNMKCAASYRDKKKVA